MCTALMTHTHSGEVLLGRTMDFSYPLAPQLYVMPKNFEWNNALATIRIRNRYQYIGVGQTIPQITFADGVNEMGLAIAALYLPGFAQYAEPHAAVDSEKIPIAAVEMVNFLLGVCKSVEEVKSTIKTIEIVGITDPITDTVSPLHWIVCDRSQQCIVIESTASGIHIYENPIGVLANSPTFDWHMENLRNYIQASPTQPEVAQWGDYALKPIGQAGGTEVLPGGYTSTARFVRTAFQKLHMPQPRNGREAVINGFHVLEGVSVPKGVVITARGTQDYTQYTAFMNTKTGEYFIRTYDNSQTITAGLMDVAADEPVSFGSLIRPAAWEKLTQKKLVTTPEAH